MKNNGDIVSFLKQKNYVMVNNDLGGGHLEKLFYYKILLQMNFLSQKCINPNMTL